MKDLGGERKVYSEFLTNLAVAWFSAGVIAPLFTPIKNIFGFLTALIAVLAGLLSLRFAVMLVRKGSRYE